MHAQTLAKILAYFSEVKAYPLDFASKVLSIGLSYYRSLAMEKGFAVRSFPARNTARNLAKAVFLPVRRARESAPSTEKNF